MLNQKEIKKETERGNALFLILIAVALFAALSYAITQSGRGSGTVNKETNIVVSGQVVEEPAAVRTAVTRMIITGTAAGSITFQGLAAATDVFDSATGGGGATNVPPPSSACSPACTAWSYVDLSAPGSYIVGVGTTAADALAWLPNVTGSVCQQIQKGLGLNNLQADLDAAHQKTLAFAAATGTAGAYAATGSATTIKSSDNTLDGQAFSCWENSTTAGSGYAYYHALIEQ